MKQSAVILQTTIRVTEFRPTFGFYNKQIRTLQDADYEILKINVDDSISLIQQLSVLSPSSVGFLWLRMHGSQKSMSASEKLNITLENIGEIFKCLTTILKKNAIIFLDSCSTGRLQPDFKNMQFAFAELTLEMPLVRIIAPSMNLHISYFSILNDGSFYFEMQNSPSSTQNIAITLGQSTKKIISDALTSNISLISIENEIKNSLDTTEICPFLENFKKEKSLIMFGSSFDLTMMLTNAIKVIQNTTEALSLVKDLIEIFHASPNFSPGFIVQSEWKFATPLSCAVYFKRSEIMMYLLEHGADLFFTLNGETILDLAKQRDNQISKDDDDVDELIICARRKRENDHSSTFDLLNQYLKRNKYTDKKLSEANIKQSFWNQPAVSFVLNEIPEVYSNDNFCYP